MSGYKTLVKELGKAEPRLLAALWMLVDAMRDTTSTIRVQHSKSVWAPLGRVPLKEQEQTGRT